MGSPSGRKASHEQVDTNGGPVRRKRDELPMAEMTLAKTVGVMIYA